MVLADAGGRGLRVAACCPQAAQQGVRPGLPWTEARSLFQTSNSDRSSAGQLPICKRADPAADRQALQQLALACQKYSPLTGLVEGDAETLLLDITGCAHLFGGEQNLLETVTRDLANRGFRLRSAIADTIGAAWAVAHDGPASSRIVPVGESARVLAPLSVAALRLPPEALDRLDRLDVRTIGQLSNLPPESLDSRFGPQLLRRLDQALGSAWENFTSERLVEPFCAVWQGDDPLTSQPVIMLVFRQLLEQLLTALAPRRVGLLELHCEFATATGPHGIPLRLSQPSTNAKHLTRLFELCCERQPLPSEIGAVRLEAIRIGSLQERQIALFESESVTTERDLASLIERLSSRLGEQAVLQPVMVADPLPELSVCWEPWLIGGFAPERAPDPERATSAPWRLLTSPQPVDVLAAVPDGPPARLHWQGEAWKIVQCWGPERLETGWWRSRDTKRDYYRVETASGLQFWLFSQRDTGRWFLHGIFD